MKFQNMRSWGLKTAAHTCDQGCIEPAITITMTLSDFNVVNNDVGNDAKDLSTTQDASRTQDASWTEGVSATEYNAKHDVSAHRASEIWTPRVRLDSRRGNSRSCTMNRESAEDSHHALKPTSVAYHQCSGLQGTSCQVQGSGERRQKSSPHDGCQELCNWAVTRTP